MLVIPVPPPTTPCYTPSSALLFAALAATDGHLLFICENHDNTPPTGEPVVVPIRRLYFVINNVTLHRVPDGAEVPVFNLSLSLDAASWTWGFEASLPASAESLVDPGAASGPVELLASRERHGFSGAGRKHQPRAHLRRREHPHLRPGA